uniref:Major capsid protein N-terminal domain-containing protein n=1 Tax=viral metagenome TaxID=1070528 RepID=A0A6C0JQ92_9ZZZZ
MSTGGVSSQVTFIDLSTYAELEAFIYGGPYATTWFVGTVQKSNWFSLVPISIRQTQQPDFGSKNVSATINRNGDYVLKLWFRVQIPQVQIANDPDIYPDATVRWTSKLGHNIFSRVYLTHNELTAQEFYSNWFDFNYQFKIPSSQRIGYRNMIGDIGKMTLPVGVNVPLGTGGYLNIPFPLWFSVDSGRALPIAALPFNDTKINYEFRGWKSLLIVYPGTSGGLGTRPATVNDIHVCGDPSQKPYMNNPETYALYAVVHNDERVKMGDAPRDILIHQIQQIQVVPFIGVANNLLQSFDIRLSHSIVGLYFAARNNTIQNLNTSSGNEHSNYTTEPYGEGQDPIGDTKLLYESTIRLSMGADYFSYVVPFHSSKCIPDETGYHLWSYALDSCSLNPCGSTNFSKLANVTITYQPSPAAVEAANLAAPVDKAGDPLVWPNQAGVPVPMPQSFEHILIAPNHNIGRVANGSFGFPTL